MGETFDPEEEKKTGVEEAETQRTRNKKGGLRKSIGTLWDNIKGAFKGNVKDIFLLKTKLIVFVVIAVLVFFALIIEGNAEDTSSVARSSTNSVFTNSTSTAAELYNNTGSLILASDTELEDVKKNFFGEIENSNESYYEAFNTKYHGRDGSTVANKVTHITTNFESNETTEINKVANNISRVSGEARLSEDKTIYEHILRAEKYNFNNIIWRSYVKSGSGVASAGMSFQVDSNTKLKYPANDANDMDNESHNLDFFVSKTRPYLQTWQIPFDIMIGTQDAQDTGNLNTNLAFETLASAYHEIVMDRYKMETLTRNTNYLVYDKTTTTNTTTRNCAEYKVKAGSEVSRKKGEACTAEDYANGLCKDSKMTITRNCTRREYNSGSFGCSDVRGIKTYTINCTDRWLTGCSYGVIKQDITKDKIIKQTLCTDVVTESIDNENDIRESKNAKKTDVITYRWNYVISLAKLFDRVISSEYEFQPYYNYSLDNYNRFINKTGSYSSMTVDEFKESESNNSRTDNFTHDSKDYYDRTEKNVINNTNWNKDNVVATIPAGAKKVANSDSSAIVLQKQTIVKDGEEYTDTYEWNDRLNFKESKSGIYNMDSVKDVTGDDLSSDDATYYNNLYLGQEINLVDLMNSDKDIYSKYMSAYEISNDTTNIGIRKSALGVSYNVLEKDLTELSETYPISGLMYGSSLGIESVGFSMLSGLNLAGITAAGGLNEAIVNYASQFQGKNLDYMMSIDDTGVFFRNHWCAMFVSYNLRKIEKETGIKIPIPSFTGCSTFWRNYKDKPGFYDVIESSAITKNTDPTHLVSIEGIQPGDIVLFNWDGSAIRHHTAIVKEVQRDASGKVTNVITIDGNWEGTSYNNSRVLFCDHKVGSRSIYSSLSSIASYISVSTVMSEAEKGNTW